MNTNPTKLDVLPITTAYEQGVGKGHQARQRGAEIDNPYADGPCREAWGLGYAEGKSQADRQRVPDGYVLVPERLPFDSEMRPTIARLARAAEQGRCVLFDDFWEELLAAAPEAPAQAEQAAEPVRDERAASKVLRNFEITGPDDDGLVWLVLHGNGTSGKGMFNLGKPTSVATQVALELEKDRRAAITKATGEKA